MASQRELLDLLADDVTQMREDEVVEHAKEYIEAGYPAYEAIMEGLIVGMGRTSWLYEQGEYFVTDVLLSSEAMYAGLEALRPYLPTLDVDGRKPVGIIGAIEGDTHDIGKNLTKVMLEAGGFEMIDLGRDVELDEFVKATLEHRPDLVCLSTLMTTTMSGMGKIIDKLVEAGVRDEVKVIIGGTPTSPAFAEKIGADGWSENAVEAVKLAKRLLGLDQEQNLDL